CLVWIDAKVTATTTQSCAAQFAFSPDGSRYAYVLGAKPQTVSIDGAPPLAVSAGPFLKVEDKQGGGLLTSTFLFSPDSKHVVYPASLTPTFQPGLVIDGKFFPIPTANGLDPINPFFTPDSRHFIVTARTPGPVSNNQLMVFVDGRPAAHFDGAAGNLLTNPW